MLQLATAFIHDFFWILFTIPPSIGFYFLWYALALGRREGGRVASAVPVALTSLNRAAAYAGRIKVIYPWISKPDEEKLSPEAEARRAKLEAKAGRVKYSKAR